MSGYRQTPHDIRGCCPCGAFLPKGTRDDGIVCNKCGMLLDPDTLRLNGFEWSEERGEWIHPERLKNDD